MTRRPNRNARTTQPGITLTFKPHRFKWLKLNKPGPSGLLGGYQNMENYIVTNTDRTTMQLHLDAVMLERLIRYCKADDTGGPNSRIRDVCIPTLRDGGINISR